MQYLSRRLNPFFGHGDARYFLARRDGRVVGPHLAPRSTTTSTRYHGIAWGKFGFLELEDDPEVMAALLAAAEGWLRARGLRPRSSARSTYDERGGRRPHRGLRALPVDPPAVAPAVLPAAVRGAGLEKAVDLLMWDLDVGQRENILPIIFELDRQAPARSTASASAR